MSKDFKKAMQEKKQSSGIPQFNPMSMAKNTSVQPVRNTKSKQNTPTKKGSGELVLVSVRLPKSLHKKVKLHAVKHDLNDKDVYREALEKYFDVKKS